MKRYIVAAIALWLLASFATMPRALAASKSKARHHYAAEHHARMHRHRTLTPAQRHARMHRYALEHQARQHRHRQHLKNQH